MTNAFVFYNLKLLINLDLEQFDEMGKAKALLSYVHALFKHNGDNVPSASDPLTIFKEAKAGSKFRCVEYSLLAVGLLWAYDIPARAIGLKTKDVETREYGAGHMVIEFWSEEYKKWIMCDVQFGVLIKHDSEKLSAYELRSCVSDLHNLKIDTLDNSKSKSVEKYVTWVKEYLYFIDTPAEITFKDINRQKQIIVMLIPVGINPPKMFQNMFEMNAYYTSNIQKFYQKPIF